MYGIYFLVITIKSMLNSYGIYIREFHVSKLYFFLPKIWYKIMQLYFVLDIYLWPSLSKYTNVLHFDSL